MSKGFTAQSIPTLPLHHHDADAGAPIYAPYRLSTYKHLLQHTPNALTEQLINQYETVLLNLVTS